MKARNQIISLINQYSFTLDSGDLDGFARLFRRGQWRYDDNPPFRGAHAVRDKLLSRVILYADGTPRTRRVATNVDINIDVHLGKARACRYVQVYQQTDQVPLQLIFSGEYHDTFFEDEDSNWHFSSCHIVRPMIGDTGNHLRNRSRRRTVKPVSGWSC